MYMYRCTYSGLQFAKQLDWQENIAWVIAMAIADSVSGFLPSPVSQENGEQNNKFLDQLIGYITCSNRMQCNITHKLFT